MGKSVKLVRYNGVLYHPNFFHRRLQCIEIFKGICQHCGKKQGDEYITQSGRKAKVILQAAHVDHDPWNKDARLIALCKSCHLKYDAPMHGEKAGKTRAREYATSHATRKNCRARTLTKRGKTGAR
jgi:5-methylcytosine-specific restriction endonuclease McrA